jgi:hypothetical protein
LLDWTAAGDPSRLRTEWYIASPILTGAPNVSGASVGVVVDFGLAGTIFPPSATREPSFSPSKIGSGLPEATAVAIA